MSEIELKICRICLRTESKVYNYEQFHLKSYYEEVLARKVSKTDDLPHFFCFECATLLHKFHKFKEKCYSGQQVLRELLKQGPITYEAIYKLDKSFLNLHSPLENLKLKYNILKVFSTTEVLIKEEIVKHDQTLTKIENIDSTEFDELIDDQKDDVFDEYDPVDTDTDSDQKPSIVENSSTDQNNTIIVEPVKILTKENEKNPKEKKVILMKRSLKRNTIKVKTEKITKKENRGTRKDGKDKLIKRTFKRSRLLNSKDWELKRLSEEDALKEFRRKAEDKKYLSAAYKCTDCFKGFSKNEMLTRHRTIRHNESGSVECNFCRMRFKWNCHLTQHIRQHYIKYLCLRCGLVCELENTAVLHDEYHSGYTKKCVHCNQVFRHTSTYYTHLRTHKSEHLCTICGSSFVSKMGLLQHKRVKHCINTEIADDDEEANTYCSRCDIRFETKKAYDEHIFHSALHSEGEEDEPVHEDVRPRKIMGKVLKAKITSQLKDEKEPSGAPITISKRKRKMDRIHKKPTTCHQCGRHFETQAECMKHHLKEHPRTSFFPPNQRHICEICGVSLAPSSIASHHNMHTRERMHACQICGRQFHSSVGVKRHSVTHTGEKPYGCTLCDKRFTQNNSMKLHYRTFHLMQPYPKRNRRKKKEEINTADKSMDAEDNTPLSEKTTKTTVPGIAGVQRATITAQQNNLGYLTHGYQKYP